MIGDGWDGEPAVRPGSGAEGDGPRARRVAVVTGSRADYGLLRPVMRAVQARQDLRLLVIAAGSHLVQPALTFRDVKADFEVADSVPMQVAGRTGRGEDVQALGAGVARFGRSFEAHNPDWVVVLGDRIEALAAACAASIGGRALAHVHGGDRAEGVSDEAIRHAVSKLGHLHLAATEASAERLRRMGEASWRVRVTGSPAIDELASMPALDERAHHELGAPEVVFLMHPVGRHAEEEEAGAAAVLAGLRGRRVLALAPNFDPGRPGIVRAISGAGVRSVEHLPRAKFVGLLKRLAGAGGVMVGNSSAGLIEAAALGLGVVNVGDRQAGRERGPNVVEVPQPSPEAVARAVAQAASRVGAGAGEGHPYGDGHAGERIAQALAEVDPRAPGVVRKLNAY